jgi:hypothetical protein
MQMPSKGEEMKHQSFTWRKLLIAMIAPVLALPAMAQVCDGIQCTDKIGHLYVSNTAMSGFPNRSVVYVDVAHPGDMHNLNCTLQSNAYLTLQPNNPGYQQIFSVLQAYTAAGKVVKIRVNTPSTNCSIAYVVVTP